MEGVIGGRDQSGSECSGVSDQEVRDWVASDRGVRKFGRE